MKEFGYTYSDFFGEKERKQEIEIKLFNKWTILKIEKRIDGKGGLPIPTFLIMLDEWNKEIERQNKEMKQTKGKRG